MNDPLLRDNRMCMCNYFDGVPIWLVMSETIFICLYVLWSVFLSYLHLDITYQNTFPNKGNESLPIFMIFQIYCWHGASGTPFDVTRITGNSHDKHRIIDLIKWTKWTIDGCAMICLRWLFWSYTCRYHKSCIAMIIWNWVNGGLARSQRDVNSLNDVCNILYVTMISCHTDRQFKWHSVGFPVNYVAHFVRLLAHITYNLNGISLKLTWWGVRQYLSMISHGFFHIPNSE